jgi:transcriptional regulator with GAF, ATPase, and Fis domain
MKQSLPMIGRSKAMEELRSAIRRTALTDMTVLIQGETGTGKELVARAIHGESARAGRPMIAMNCASLPESLVETELFGHERGAFTGADASRKGKFEQADGGTLFLDEVGETSLAVQAKLLRVLQEGEIDKVGGQKPFRVDFRLIAATNRDLLEMVADGKFREDLYYRLNVDIIRTTPLRERPEDIGELAQHFFEHYAPLARRAVEGIAPVVLDLLRNYPWKGNVRELQNVIQRAVLAGQSDMVELEDLPPCFFPETVTSTVGSGGYYKAMREQSRQLCVWALTASKGNRRIAAKLLGLNRTAFYRIVRQNGLGNMLDA